MNNQCTDIIPIIVTFNPDATVLLKSLAALLSQGQVQIIVVDNHSRSDVGTIIQHIEKKTPNRINLIKLSLNHGLGEAYNKGIAIARKLNATHILLLDQDSIPEQDMISKLHCTYQDLENQGIPVAAVAPRYRYPASSKLSQFVRVASFGLTRIACSEHSTHYVRADFLISSGSLISLRVLEQVGGMDEGLFIDHIDTEWCFRAQAKGFTLYGVCDAVMQHSLGDRQARFWWGRWRNISFHQSFRYYYMFRNSVLLWQRPYMPIVWKRADLLRLIYLFFFFAVFSPNRLTNLRMMIKGLRDGFNQRTGKL
ncbi:MAG: glycosyltransferase family 2 protein [Nitrosomonas sp.]|nr:MAG: glycosyltransferase family 2 protein [Nitrosomonas sp.]